MMKLDDYLSRIEYAGTITADLECLTRVHRQHLLHIPYENLDVQLENPVDMDIERIFEKIVHRRRGGWCYEMNGLLGWALTEIGFDVMRMAGGVLNGEKQVELSGNHLVLAVQLDQPYIADVGLGNSIVEPAALREGPFAQDFREFNLERIDDDLWRFDNFPGAFPTGYEFRFQQADEALLGQTCAQLQADPESMFKQNLICLRLRKEGVSFLLGRMLFTFAGLTSTQRSLDSSDDLGRTLSTEFGIHDVSVSTLWNRVTARHAELFEDQASDENNLDEA